MKIFKFELRCAKFYVELEIYCGYAIMYLLQLCSFMDTEPVSSIREKLLSSLSLQQLKVRAKSTVVACIVCYSNDVNCTQLIRTVHASVISTYRTYQRHQYVPYMPASSVKRLADKLQDHRTTIKSSNFEKKYHKSTTSTYTVYD